MRDYRESEPPTGGREESASTMTGWEAHAKVRESDGALDMTNPPGQPCHFLCEWITIMARFSNCGQRTTYYVC